MYKSIKLKLYFQFDQIEHSMIWQTDFGKHSKLTGWTNKWNSFIVKSNDINCL